VAYTTAEIATKQTELDAITTAYTQSIATGGVEEFKQGATYFKKATTAQLKTLKNETENELYRMENV